MTLAEQRTKQHFRLKHKIDTETLRCSCKAPMCFSCGWCSASCDCTPEEKEAAQEMENKPCK